MIAVAATGRARLMSRVLAIAGLAALVLLGGWSLAPAWLAPWHVKLARLLETAVLAITMLVAVALADKAARHGVARRHAYPVAVVGGAFAGAWLAWEIRLMLGITMFMPPGEVLFRHFAIARRLDLFLMGLLIGGLATYAHVKRLTALGALRRQHSAEQARAKAQKQMLESKLQELQARIEPQFLFATLSGVHELYDRDAARAGVMLENLIIHLRAALPHMRESSSTVEQESLLVRSWLDIVGQPEMHWCISVDVANEALQRRLPSLVLLPLVQQAVSGARKSGDPFDLRICISCIHATLAVRLETSADSFAHGIAGQPLLEQVQERVRALYGQNASFSVRGTANESAVELTLPTQSDAIHRTQIVDEDFARAL